MNQHKISGLRLIKALVFSTLLLSGCSDGPDVKPGANNRVRPEAKPSAVAVANPMIGLSASYYQTTATIEPSSDAEVFARTAGVVRKIYKEEGDVVSAGETLLQLEDDEQKLRVKQAKQNLANTQHVFKRISKMNEAGAVSPTDWEEAKNSFESAQTDLDLAELALSYTKVSAPFNGRVVWREVDLGAHVLSGNLLFRVMAIEPLLLRVHVPANRIGKVAVDQSVDLKVDSLAKAIKGKVHLVSPIVDPDTGTVKVTIRIDDFSDKIRPGDFTQVRMITDSRENAMLLPSVAVIEERGGHFVFVEEDGKAVRKDVEVGFVVDTQTEILSGLELSDKVVVKGQRNLNNGNLIKVMALNGEPVSESPNTVRSEEEKSRAAKKVGEDKVVAKAGNGA
ncbi:efflux RND transporter periplasmic adaptor subunit [Aliikangiella sp. G2MR2-5]|uniref:efflux RND transporter periplasmic adaptor subunit n=1 Tax=Aliikangiella sp. G2MR2-5 TaxID=2788943 RepID=UPI0018A93524|nr:efflux RND transporter periplasmic adaptor subunit [Aliikangiella sp. G2MR2-5]